MKNNFTFMQVIYKNVIKYIKATYVPIQLACDLSVNMCQVIKKVGLVTI